MFESRNSRNSAVKVGDLTGLPGDVDHDSVLLDMFGQPAHARTRSNQIELCSSRWHSFIHSFIAGFCTAKAVMPLSHIARQSQCTCFLSGKNPRQCSCRNSNTSLRFQSLASATYEPEYEQGPKRGIEAVLEERGLLLCHHRRLTLLEDSPQSP